MNFLGSVLSNYLVRVCIHVEEIVLLCESRTISVSMRVKSYVFNKRDFLKVTVFLTAVALLILNIIVSEHGGGRGNSSQREELALCLVTIKSVMH